MKKIKIYGEPNPVIGIKQYYSIHDFFGNAAKTTFIEPQFETMPEESIKWSIWVLIGNTWTKMTKNNKTGATVDYTFTPDSLTRKGIRMLVDANGEKAVLDIETKKTEEIGILYVEILDRDKKKPDKLFHYNEKIIARVHCLNMEKYPVTVTLWEDDGGKKKLTDIAIDTKKGVVLNGKADIELYLNPKYAWSANARKAPGDDNEGAFHEYYVTAEFYQKVSKPSRDINVVNPDYKNYPPAPKPAPKQPEAKKEWPAEKKGPSKKEQRGIQTDRKVLDHHETKMKVENKISTKPYMDPISSFLTFDIGDSVWNQKKDKVCEAEARVRAFMRMLRVKEDTVGDSGYEKIVGGESFIKDYKKDWSSHPKIPIYIKRINQNSNAAGAYQFMGNTYDEIIKNYGARYKITDFSKEAQDKMCLVLMKHYYTKDRPDSFYNIQNEKSKNWRKRFKGQQADIVQLIIDGDIKRASLLSSLCWASLPDSPYGQQSATYTFADVKILYEKFLKEELAEKSDLYLKKGFLKEFNYNCCAEQSPIETGSCNKCNQDHYDIANSEYWVHQQPSECWKASIEILANYGLKNNSGYPQNRIIMADQSGVILIPKETQNAINYIDSQLKVGKPVLVGLDDNLRQGTYNTHKATEHFFVIVGKGCDEGKRYYRFFDVGAHSRELGTGENSRLFLLENGLLQGKSAGGTHNYTVTEVRKNN